MLELVDITEPELEDYLFMKMPARTPLARARLKIELAVKQMWDRDIEHEMKQSQGMRLDSEEKPVISPGTLYELEFIERWKKTMTMTVGELEHEVHKMENGRFAEAVEKNDYIGQLDPTMTIEQNMSAINK